MFVAIETEIKLPISALGSQTWDQGDLVRVMIPKYNVDTMKVRWVMGNN
jgi:hypothetical protein